MALRIAIEAPMYDPPKSFPFRQLRNKAAEPSSANELVSDNYLPLPSCNSIGGNVRPECC